MNLKKLPLLKKRDEKPIIAQVTMHIHVKAEQEYHTCAYAVRVTGDKTELLVADKNQKLIWLDTVQLEVVETADSGLSPEDNKT